MIWRLLSAVRPRERERFTFFALLFGLITLAQTLGLAGSEALLLSELGVEVLPLTFIAASLLTVVGNFAYAIGVDRARNDVYFIRLFLAGAVVLLVLAGCSFVPGWTWVYPALFCFYFVTLAVFTNHYWTFTGDFFDTLGSKRLFPLFVVGNSLGGLVGGVVVVVLGSYLPAIVLIFGWAITLVIAAVQIRLYKRPLRRWGPLELEEADETSLEGIKAAVRYLRQSALGRWMVCSALAMVLALFVAQFLYSTIFVRAFPEADKLAVFLGVFLACTNLMEIVVEAWLTPLLIRRVGVAKANLIHPVLTIVTFLALARGGLPAAMLSRFNREALENSLAGPVRSLVYNALPARFRGRIRAFLEGIVVYSGMTIAGVALLAVGHSLTYPWLCLAGGGLALLYLIANLKVRTEYLRTLVAELRAGRLDLADLGMDIGGGRLVELWRALLHEDPNHPSRALLQLAPVLARRGVTEPLIQGLNHVDPRLRAACLGALGETQGPAAVPMLLKGLKDPVPEVARAALRSFTSVTAKRDEVKEVLLQMVHHPDPELAARAAYLLGPQGRARLAEMVQSPEPAQAAAALEFLPQELATAAVQKLESDSPRVLASALEALARLHLPVHVPSDRLMALLHHPDPSVRLAAVRCAGLSGEEMVLTSLASALGDPALEVRRLAAETLGTSSLDVVQLVEPYLSSYHTATVEAAAAALAATQKSPARELLAGEFRRRVEAAWKHMVSLHVLPEDPSLALRFLRAAYEDAAGKNRRLAFRLLELLEDAKVIRSVEKVLRFASARTRSDALEVLSNLGDREASNMLVLLLEDGTLEEKLPAVTAYVAVPRDGEEVLEQARSSDNQWIKLAAGSHDRAGEVTAREEKMERLLVLRKVPLFAQMTLEQLEAINQLVTEEQYLEGELIFREGDVGGELYLLVDGEVKVVKNHGTPDELLLATLHGVSYFGEMAILDDEPRSASVVVAKDARLLALKGDRLKELVLQMPEIAFEIFKVLTARIRSSDQRLAQAKTQVTAGAGS